MHKIPKIHLWLSNTVSLSKDGRYCHRLLKEDLSFRPKVIDELRSVVQAAHADAKRHLRDLAGINLDPLAESNPFDPAQGYPECLHPQTLKGYLGEILAGIVAENYPHFGIDGWEVPAYLFRFHDVEFDQLEKMHQITGVAQKRPGRTGDDNIAFYRDQTGKITKSLICEAKCTADHDAGLIADAHEKISDSPPKPVSIRQLISILLDYEGPIAKQWVDELRMLWLLPISPLYERCDLVSYTCGRSPVQGAKKTWMDTDKPHPKYCGGRRLEAVEIHLEGVEILIREVYGQTEVIHEPAE